MLPAFAPARVHGAVGGPVASTIAAWRLPSSVVASEAAAKRNGGACTALFFRRASQVLVLQGNKQDGIS